MTRISFIGLFLVSLVLFAAWPAHAALTDNGDGTVSDDVTGLMWDKCSWGQSNNTTCAGGAATTHDWYQALSVAVTANAASYKGHSDWRLPNVNELESLVKIDAASPAVDTTVFPNTISSYYWTASTYVSDQTRAWPVGFEVGDPFFLVKTNTNYVRLVRNGQSFTSFDRFADLAAPAYQSAALNAANTVATLTFDEAPLNNLADLATLKAAVTFAADGTTFSALAGGDAVAISGSTVTVTFATPLTGSTNKIKIAANSLKDDHGNVLASAATTGALAANDITAPAYQSAALNAGLTVATLTFDETLVNNLASIDPLLKANVTFAADGTTFSALAGGDVVALSGSTLTVTFASALSGATNKVKIAANSLKDAAGNALASAATTAALDATDTTPSAFSFTAQTGAALSTATESNAITVTGINAAAAISISGGQYAVSTDNGGSFGAYTAGAGTVNLNDQVKVKLTSSNSYSTAATATLTIGGVNGTFSVTTLAAPAPAYDPGPYVPPAPTLINAGPHMETTLTGTTPVTAEPGSILVVPAGIGAAGAVITLPAPTGSGEAVTIKLNGKVLSVTPLGDKATVTLKKVTINGVETLVLAVTGGTVSVGAQAGQPLLAVAGSVVLTAGDNGGAVSTRSDGDSGSTVAVTGGYVILPSNAFASTNAFATIQDGRLFAGEVAVLDAGGKVARVRLGSLAVSGALGDPLNPATKAGLESKVVVPDLKGKVARISEKDDFTAALATALGKDFTVQGQNADGVLSLGFPGGKLQALPYGDITIDTSRADGVTLTAANRAELAKSGVITRFAPAVGDFATFTASLTRLDKAAMVAVQEDGMVHMRFKGVTYPLQPAWTVTPDKDGQAGLSTDEQGMFVYVDGAGYRQTLYPVFADLPRLLDVFKALDATAGVTGNSDGTATAKFMGKTFTLKPDYRLTNAPTDQAGKDWWLDFDGKVFIRNGDGSAQGFEVR